MATTTNFGWETPDDTDLVKDGAAAIRTLGSSIDTSMMDLKGGTTGQVLSKTSNTDMDFTWVTSDDANAIQNAIVDAKGDLITATAADTPARLAVGTNGQILTADSTTATGLKWAAASSGALVLIKAQTAFSNVANTGNTFDNIFSSTYTTYVFVIEDISAATQTDTIRFRTIAGGSAGTSNNYNGNTQYSSRDGSTITNNPQSTQTSFTLAPAGTASEERCSSYTITFTNVGVAKEPRWYGQGVYGVNTGSINFGYVYFGGAQHNGSTAVQGIQLLSSSSNITGSVSVYAYVES